MSKAYFGSSAIAIAAALLGATPVAAQQAAKPPAAKPPAQKEIVVTGTRADVVSSADRTSFNVANDLQVQTGTLADALRAVPGVEVNLEGGVSLRGDTGVKILVDGRPSALLNGEGRDTAVLTMPAGQIERVEVITNPSAAESPEGSGGVINLIMKRARADTRSATVRGNVGAEGRRSLSLNASLSGPKLTATADLNHRRFTGDGSIEQLRENIGPAGAVTDSRRDNDFAVISSGQTGRGAIDYDFDKSNRLSTELNLFGFRNRLESEETFESDDASASFNRDADANMRMRGGGGRVSWRRTLPGPNHELVTDLAMQSTKFSRDIDAITTFAAEPDNYERIRNAFDRTQKTVKADYKRPIGKEGSLNIGYNGDFSRSEFDFEGAGGPSFSDLMPLPAFTNSFDYDQAVHALFGTYNFKLGKLGAIAGLRLEQVEIEIDQITDDLQYEDEYFRAYPTLHLAYDLTDTQKLRASYSRRIQRPSPQDLNPYTFYLDRLNQLRGNPFLRPEVTDSFEASWQTRKGSSFYSLTGFYRDSKDGVTDIFTDLGDGIILITKSNLGTAKRVGVEAIANGKLSKTLSYNASGSFQWNEIDPKTGGFSAPRSGTTGTARASLDWQPTPKDFFQLSGNYSGRQLLPQGYRDPGGVLNAGYRRKVNDKLSLLLTAQNVLDSARQTTFFETATLRQKSVQQGAGRIFLIGASYTFGQNGRRQKEPAFDFQQPAGDTPQ